MLLGYHLLWSTTASVLGTDEQADRFQKLIVGDNLVLGGAVNPRDSDLRVADAGDHVVFSGLKHFSTGGVVSDLTVLEGVLLDGGTTNGGQHAYAIVDTRQPGIQFAHNWDNMGLRLTESGSVAIEDVAAPWGDVLGWDAREKRPISGIGDVPFASLLLPTWVVVVY